MSPSLVAVLEDMGQLFTAEPKASLPEFLLEVTLVEPALTVDVFPQRLFLLPVEEYAK